MGEGFGSESEAITLSLSIAAVLTQTHRFYLYLQPTISVTFFNTVSFLFLITLEVKQLVNKY